MKTIYTLLSCTLIATMSLAQDGHFSQFYASPLYLNPALAGIEQNQRVTLNYRNQWANIKNSYVTYNASLDKYSKELLGGIGINILHDRAGAGALSTSALSFVYAYEIKVNRNIAVRAGASVILNHKSVNLSNLIFEDMIDPRRGVVYPTKQATGNILSLTYADLSVGMMVYTDMFYGGFVVDHLGEPKQGLLSQEGEPVSRKYTFHGGAKIPFTTLSDESRTVSPNILISKQGSFTQINVGMYLQLGKLIMGTWYRSNDAIIFLVGVEAKKIKLGYSYDITTSSLATAVLGSHEISYTKLINHKKGEKPVVTNSCPMF